MKTETEIELAAPVESVFMATLKRCPPRATGTRAILEILHFLFPDLEADESLRQENGELLPAAASYTALRVVKEILGSLHPAVIQMERDLREEWAR